MHCLRMVLLSLLVGLLVMPAAEATSVSVVGKSIVISSGGVLLDHGAISVRDTRTGVVTSPRPLARIEQDNAQAVVRFAGDIGSLQVHSDVSCFIIEFNPARPGLSVAFSADVHLGSRTIACRLAPEPGAKMAQFAFGPAASERCNSLFDIASDTAITIGAPDWLSPAGSAWRLQTPRFPVTTSGVGLLWLNIIKDYYKKQRGYNWYAPLDMSVFKQPPAGWCSWYYYGTSITEAEMIKNADWISKNLKQFGCQYVQLDDGYQTLSWTVWNSKFPHGGKWLADQIHDRGLKAGLWLTPFSNDETELLKAHPDWFIHDDQGKTVRTFRSNYTIDASNPAVLDGWLKPLYKTLAIDWGYDYFKHDAQTEVEHVYRTSKMQRPDVRPGEAYRCGLKAIRDVVTSKRFILSCSGTAVDGVGVIDGTRTGGDVGADWMGLYAGWDCTRSQVFLNNIAWFCDPDVVCVRDPLTLDQARVWASMVGLTGQLFIAGDNLSQLPKDRVEVLRRALPVARLLPMDLYPLSAEQMDTFDVKVARPFGSWDVVGLFNYTEVPRYTRISAISLSLPQVRRGYHVYDFWNKRYLGLLETDLTLDLPGTSCRVLSVCPATDHPQVISTSRHITQGAMDLKSVSWDPRHSILSGESDIVGGDPYTITIASVPSGRAYRVLKCFATDARVRTESAGDLVKLTLESAKSRSVKWQVAFEKSTRGACSPAAPNGLKVSLDGADKAIVSWSPPANAPECNRYIVSKNGKQVAIVSECRFRDEDLLNGTACIYRVCTVDSVGRHSAAVTAKLQVPVRTDTYITQMHPTRVHQGYGVLQKDRTVTGRPMSIRGVKYEHGLGTMPLWKESGHITYKLAGGYARFEAEVGIDDTAQGNGTVTFEVWGDGKKLYDSGMMTGKDQAKKLSVDIRGVSVLDLVVTDCHDGNWWDHSDWANARLFAE